MIEFKNVNKSYGETKVLQDLSFRIETGEFAVMIGPSGCGKTTTLKTINRLIEPDSGSVLIDGKDVCAMDKVELRRGIGYVIQQIGLFPNMTVEQNIGVVPKMLKYSKEKISGIVHEMLALVGMPYEEYAHKYPSQLSGGQQQRVGVLRALAASPPIVLMDEPFGALDPMARAVLQQEVSRLQKQLNKTMVFVTHDMNEALDIADKIIFMDKGQIVQMGAPQEFITNPANDFIRSFIERRGAGTNGAPQTAADVMQTEFCRIRVNATTQEAVETMNREGVQFLIVEEADGTYVGSLLLKWAAKYGDHTIAELADKGTAVSYVGEDAQTCFGKLLNGKNDHVVVLSNNNIVAGIVTKTSMAQSLADTVWGNGQ